MPTSRLSVNITEALYIWSSTVLIRRVGIEMRIQPRIQAPHNTVLMLKEPLRISSASIMAKMFDSRSFFRSSRPNSGLMDKHWWWLPNKNETNMQCLHGLHWQVGLWYYMTKKLKIHIKPPTIAINPICVTIIWRYAVSNIFRNFRCLVMSSRTLCYRVLQWCYPVVSLSNRKDAGQIHLRWNGCDKACNKYQKVGKNIYSFSPKPQAPCSSHQRPISRGKWILVFYTSSDHNFIGIRRRLLIHCSQFHDIPLLMFFNT